MNERKVKNLLEEQVGILNKLNKTKSKLIETQQTYIDEAQEFITLTDRIAKDEKSVSPEHRDAFREQQYKLFGVFHRRFYLLFLEQNMRIFDKEIEDLTKKTNEIELQLTKEGFTVKKALEGLRAALKFDHPTWNSSQIENHIKKHYSILLEAAGAEKLSPLVGLRGK